MSNDSSIITIDSLELQIVTGGMIPIPAGGTGMEIPGGGSLTCPAGTAPDHTKVSGSGSGSLSTEGGIFKLNLKGSVNYEHDHCVAVPTPKKK
ncbi:MAG TPA: hypothetical protein VHT91_20940 [Kofleriaceae bacterium]|jgi:hypothetical protein|nr:hypothetical protein [Kofleriaceae bacterium]